MMKPRITTVTESPRGRPPLTKLRWIGMRRVVSRAAMIRGMTRMETLLSSQMLAPAMASTNSTRHDQAAATVRP